MKSVLFSINKPHTDNIKKGIKTSELRTVAPNIKEPFKCYIYETKRKDGCGSVIGEFICHNMITWRMCMGIPAHLIKTGCVTEEDLYLYSHNGEKDITEIKISNLIIYDTPKELCEFGLIRPPQSWRYVDIQS